MYRLFWLDVSVLFLPDFIICMEINIIICSCIKPDFMTLWEFERCFFSFFFFSLSFFYFCGDDMGDECGPSTSAF